MTLGWWSFGMNCIKQILSYHFQIKTFLIIEKDFEGAHG
jgi:hypothetical protein